MPIYTFEGHIPQIGKNCFIAPNASIIGNVSIGDNCSIWFGAVIRGDVNKITIGSGTNVQDTSVIHCNTDKETIIGNNVTIGHGVLIHAATIKDGALVGNRSVVHDNVIVGEESLIAPGCVLTDRTEIKPKTLAVGIPGVFKRNLTEKNLVKIRDNNRRYIKLIERYGNGFKEVQI